MLKLRKILLCNYIYYIITSVVILITIYRAYSFKSIYQEGSFTEKVIISENSFDGNKWNLVLNGKEKIKATYVFTEESELSKVKEKYHNGDLIEVEGILTVPAQNTIPNTFNYQDYLKGEKIFNTLEITKVSLKEKSRNPFYKVKNIIQQEIEKRKIAKYYQTFILGDTTYLNQEVKNSYQNNGISHLFAISGMHISLLSGVFLKGLEKVGCREKTRYIATLIFLYFFLFLTGGSASILRSVIFFTLLSINRVYYFYVSPINLFLITFSLVLLYSPFIVLQVGFQFSFLISFFLLLTQEIIKEVSKKKATIIVSVISFVVSLPVSLYHFSQINFLSIFYNLFYVPFVSIFLFPAVLLSFFIPPLEFIGALGIFILEKTSLFLAEIKIGIIYFRKPSLLFCLIFILILIFAILWKNRSNKKLYLILLIMVIYLKIKPVLENDSYLFLLDIGQGDSIFIKSKRQTILIDTGGKMTFKVESWKKRKNNTTIFTQKLYPFFKSIGVNKLDILVLTHGDMDHLGEAKELLQKFPVGKVYFNLGKLNSNEKKLIPILKNKKIPYEKIKTGASYQIGSIFFQSLNKTFEDENDSSVVLYGTIDNFKFLLMGDASLKTEKWILDTYLLEEIDILKLGHHGSRTSTGKDFLDKIKPKLAIISAGKDNKFKHPNKEVTSLLKEKDIPYYVTSESGSIEINFSKGGTIKSYPP